MFDFAVPRKSCMFHKRILPTQNASTAPAHTRMSDSGQNFYFAKSNSPP